MPVLGQDFYMVQGEDVVMAFLPDGTMPNIATWSLRWQLRPADGSPTVAVSKDSLGRGGLTVGDPVNGLILVTLAKNDTINLQLQAAPWYWELRRIDAGASTSLAKGTLTIDSPNAAP